MCFRSKTRSGQGFASEKCVIYMNGSLTGIYKYIYLDSLKMEFLEEVGRQELQGFAMLCLHLGVPVSSPVVLFILSALRFQERLAAGTSAILYPQSGPHIIRPAASEANILYRRDRVKQKDKRGG